MNGIPPVSGPQGASAGNFSDATFSQLGDAAWEALYECQTYPNAVNIQAAMQCINALDSYLTANPPPGGDPQYSTAMAVLAALGQKGGMVGYTLAEVCQMFGTSNCSNAVEAFQGQMSLFTPLYQALDQIQTVGSQNAGDTIIQNDIDQLKDDISSYNEYCANPNPTVLNALLTAVATDIKQLNTDMGNASPPITDGYLTVLQTYLNTPIQPGGSETLESLSAAVLANNPPAQTDLDALENALGDVGENQADGGAFLALIEKTLEEEY
ncbi:MAG: hypothetical protein JSS10_01730 [Verrucomicrobia bacterium]|nr:hypothetical protein [Verrucomicrobiota bacterium]